MSYDIIFRKRALEYMDDGHTYDQLYEAFKIFPATLISWRNLLEETGSLKARKYVHKPKKINPQKLKNEVEKKPDAYLSELAAIFNCSTAAIHKQLVKNNITRKKNFYLCGKGRRKTKSVSKKT
jgi:transposase